MSSQHPEWPPEQVAAEAMHQFNEASRVFWTESIALAKKLRPQLEDLGYEVIDHEI